MRCLRVIISFVEILSIAAIDMVTAYVISGINK